MKEPLRFKFPVEVSDGGPKITEADIKNWELKTKLRFPEDYRKFLLRWNGGRLKPSSLDAESGGRLSFSRPAPLAEHWPMEEDTPPGFINMGDDWGGNHFLICLRGHRYGQIYWADHEMLPDEGILRHLFQHVPRLWKHFYPNLKFVASNFTDLVNRLYSLDFDYLDHLAEKNDLPALREFVKDHGVNFKDRFGGIPLEKVAWNGSFEMVKFLVESGADFGEALLRGIVNGKGNYRIVEYLLEHGANPNHRNEHHTALQFARKKNEIVIADLLVRHGASG